MPTPLAHTHHIDTRHAHACTTAAQHKIRSHAHLHQHCPLASMQHTTSTRSLHKHTHTHTCVCAPLYSCTRPFRHRRRRRRHSNNNNSNNNQHRSTATLARVPHFPARLSFSTVSHRLRTPHAHPLRSLYCEQRRTDTRSTAPATQRIATSSSAQHDVMRTTSALTL